ncbi:MAG: hypothetical protein J7647_25840 [Cyanobacteria bacterium SBLK]|nr:hypothetical protein [Cyanobacteria bacterium SBLK]
MAIEKWGIFFNSPLFCCRDRYIDKKTAEEHNITSLEQFKDPEIAKLFDSD